MHSFKPLSCHNLFLCFALFLSSPIKAISDHTALVYKNCGSEPFPFPTPYSETLLSLFQQLVTHSSQSTFFTTLAGDANTAISGLFQCRRDLSATDCYNCVNKLHQMSTTLCGQSAAARIQLLGCYVEYELDGAFDGTPDGHEQLVAHKTCGEPAAGGGEFEEAREAAFAEAERGVVIGDGFYGGSYGGMEVMAQCEEGLGGCDCEECVDRAMQIARDDCGMSAEARIYLDRCFLSYSYYAQGVPRNSYEKGREHDNDSAKKAAIVVGAAAALCFGFIFLLFIKSMAKKDDDY